MRRLVSIVAVVSLGLLSCASGDDDDFGDSKTSIVPAPTVTESSSSSSSSSSPPPSTALETTLPPTATTVPLPPWTTLEPLAWPEPTLTDEFGGPRTVESVCLDLTLTAVDDETEALQGLETALVAFGMVVVDEGCELDLNVQIAGSRSASKYTDPDTGLNKTCWAAKAAVGQVVMLVDGEQVGVWAADWDDPLPDSVRGCAAEDTPIGSRYWKTPVVVALAEAFGTSAVRIALGATLGWTYTDAYERLPALRDKPDYAEILTAALSHTSPDIRDNASRRVMNWAREVMDEPGPYPDDLWSTIPYLIACGAQDGMNNAFNSCGAADSALVALFYRVANESDADPPIPISTTDPRAWWNLWETHPTPPR